jgi:hypothetical protein
MTILKHIQRFNLPQNWEFSLLGGVHSELFLSADDGTVSTFFVFNLENHSLKEIAEPFEKITQDKNLFGIINKNFNDTLNFGILRDKGMRELERLSEWVHPLSIQQKMLLIQKLELKIAPMMVFGLAYSRVVAVVNGLVIRTLGIAQALPTLHNQDQQTYDYVVRYFGVVHPFVEDDDLLTDAHLQVPTEQFIGVALDVVFYNNQLIVLDFDKELALSRLVIWDVE